MVECCKTSRKIGRMRTTAYTTGNRPAGERVCQTLHGSADTRKSRDKDGYNLPLAAVSLGPLEEADLFILRSGEPEIGEADGDLT